MSVLMSERVGKDVRHGGPRRVGWGGAQSRSYGAGSKRNFEVKGGGSQVEVASNRGVKTQRSSLLQYLTRTQQEYRMIMLGSPISTLS